MRKVVRLASSRPVHVDSSTGAITLPGRPEDVLGTAPVPVLVVDPSGRVTALNTVTAALPSPLTAGARLEETPGWAWLAHAHRMLLEPGTPATETDPPVADPPVAGRVGARTFRAHPARRTDGSVLWWLVEDTDRLSAEEALRTEQDRTAFLAKASNLLLASLNTDRCMQTTAQLAAEHLADAAVVVAPLVRRRFPVAYAVRGGSVTLGALTADPAEVPGLSEALQGFPPVPSRWIDPALLPDWVLPPGLGTAVGSVMIIPLPGHGVPAGALILLRGTSKAGFSDSEEVFTRLFSARVGSALAASRLYAEQSAITQTLMRELLPPTMRHAHGVEFAGGYSPAGPDERVGGDFYDIHPAGGPGQETFVVLGDVCGKGLEAAVLTGKIRNTLHALLPMADDHGKMLALLNGALLDSHHARFATLVMASVSREGADVRLRLTSAGHPAPLIVRADGSVQAAETHGTLVGAFPEISTTTTGVVLQPGETCLLFTDGVTEARGGPLGDELFGEDRLARALADCAGMPAEAVVERIQMLTAQWLDHNPHDDIAVLAITAPRSAHLSAVDGRTAGRFTA